MFLLQVDRMFHIRCANFEHGLDDVINGTFLVYFAYKNTLCTSLSRYYPTDFVHFVQGLDMKLGCLLLMATVKHNEQRTLCRVILSPVED